MRRSEGGSSIQKLTHAPITYTDIVDYVEPVMLIVGSRGLGNLKG